MKESLKEVSKCYRAVEAAKITSKEDQSEIDKWSEDVERLIEDTDQKIELLEQWLSETEVKREDQQRKKCMQFEKQK